jgi:hypothetical protein
LRKPPVFKTNVTSAVVGVRISHPDRLIYPELAISKIQLARYYERIADWTVPHVVIPKGWTRTTNPHRLLEEQSHEHVGVRVFATGSARGDGVDAAELERPG